MFTVSKLLYHRGPVQGIGNFKKLESHVSLSGIDWQDH